MDGIIVINKEKEYTSHDVVAKLKKKLNISKVGHTGTLDPNATGVLPILIGKGTKFSKYLINHDKIYEVELELGKKTDTADIEGKVIEEKEVDEEYRTTLINFGKYKIVMFAMAKLMEMETTEQNKVALYLFNCLN